MSGTSVLLDTNIVLYLLAGDKTLAAMLNDKEVFVSFITEMELLLPDNIIAASSLQLNIPLLTADSDFKQVRSLDYVQYEK